MTAIFSSKFAMIIYSFIIAICVWTVLSIKIYPTTAKTVRSIPVTVKLPSDTEGEFQLQEHQVETVDIKIEANRSQIGNLTADDFTAVVDASSMKEPGTETFSINVKCSKNITYVVDSVSAETDTVVIDKTESKEVNVSVYAPNIQVLEGYRLEGDAGQCNPGTVTVTGPSQLLRKIEYAQVILDTSKEINTSYTTYSDKIKFYDENGAEVESENLKASSGEYIISFDVLTEKNLDLTYQLKNQPTGFNEEWFRKRITLSNDKILLAAKGSDIDDLKSWDFGSVSLNDIDIDYSKTVSVDVPSEYQNVSGIDSVMLNLDNEGLATREITINDINVINTPIGYTDFNVTTNSLTITLVGDEEQIEEISQSDIVANINLVGYKIQSYAFNYDVTLSFGNYDKVWAYGSYKASVSCTSESEDDED
jgi:YbbR domain-containing protein